MAGGMAADKGGRRVDGFGLEQTVPSPMHTVCSTSAGSEHFKEPLQRHLAEDHTIEDKRLERKDRGYVHFRPEANVPDVGGLGWRTRAGHLLKNQAYYSAKPNTNKWDLPIHAGINTWKEWHGPRMRTDADMMERMDRYDEESDEWEAKKTWINTIRADILDRFYNQKLSRDQKEAAPSWAPHRRSRREVHDSHEHFFADLDAKPEKELKKVLTDTVLQRDRDAIRTITKRIQNEETWKLAWKHMEQERRQDIRHDFAQRQHYNNLLMHLSGQPVRNKDDSSSMRMNNCSQRTEELAVPREAARITDVTSLSDFRGLHHADNEHALEALFPGSGHELSVEFRKRATASTKAGFPPPPAPETPRVASRGQSMEASLQKEASLTTETVPVSKVRLERVAARLHDDTLKKHAKAQFLSTVAPPPPNQSKQLLKEDFSPKTTMQDPGRVTGKFERTDHGSLQHGPYHPSAPVRKGMETLPPPQRSYVYPVLAPTSPNAKGAQASGQPSEMSFPSSPMASMQASKTQPNFMSRKYSSPASLASQKQRARGARNTASAAVCQELDDFEAGMSSLPRVSNFFGTPRSHRRAMMTHPSGQSGLSRAVSDPSLQRGSTSHVQR